MARPLIITRENPFWGGDSKAFFDKLNAINLPMTEEGHEFVDWRQIEARYKIACRFLQHNPGPRPADILIWFIQLNKGEFGELIISKKLLLEKGLPTNKECLLKELWKNWSHFPSQFKILNDV